MMRYSYDMIDLIAALIGSLVVGGLLGLVPLICGLVKKRVGLALGGFFACLGGGLILGLILAVPLCVLFTVLIFVTKPKTMGAPYGQYPGQMPYQGPAGQYYQPPARPVGGPPPPRRSRALHRKKCLGGTGAEINQTKGNGPRPFLLFERRKLL